MIMVLVEQSQIAQSRDAPNVRKIHTIAQYVVNASRDFSPIDNSASLANSPAQPVSSTLMQSGLR